MTTPSLFDQATQALNAGDTLQARNLLTQLLKTDPQDAQAWVLLSACWNEPEKKRFCLEKAASLKPDDPQIHLALSDLAAWVRRAGCSRARRRSNGLPPDEPAAAPPPDAPVDENPPQETAPAEAAPAGQPPAGAKPKSRRPPVVAEEKI